MVSDYRFGEFSEILEINYEIRKKAGECENYNFHIFSAGREINLKNVLLRTVLFVLRGLAP